MRIPQWTSPIRLAVRSLAQSPVVASLIVATIALVICGVTLMASFIVGTLVDKGPYRQPERVLGFQYIAPSITYPRIYFPLDDYDTLRGATMGEGGVFEAVSALGVAYVMMTGQGDPAHLNAGVMPGQTFGLLGVSPLLGRTLTPEDDRADAASVIVLSEEVWRQSFGARPDAIGRIVKIDGRPHEIVGVMPARFTWGVLTAWLPMRMDLYGGQTGRFVQIAGWLKPGVTEARAKERLQRAFAGMNAQGGGRYPAEASVSFGRPALPAVQADVRQTLFVLLAGVILLAVIGCVNVAALLLARASSRMRDVVIRLALGASRARVVRTQLVETAVLSLVGALAGVALAHLLLPALLAALPPFTLPLGAVVAIDWRVLIAMAVVTMLVCLACGLLPALRVTRTALEPLLRQGTAASGTGIGSRRVWRLLIGAEMAMAMSLLVLTGIFTHGLITLEAEPLGYDPSRIVQLGVTVSPNRYATAAQRTGFLAQALDRIRAVPDVEVAAVGVPSSPRSVLPGTFRLVGGTHNTDERVGLRIVSADFHRAFAIPLLRGRALSAADERAALPVAVVNDAFARQHGGGAEIIGRQVAITGITALTAANRGTSPGTLSGTSSSTSSSSASGAALMVSIVGVMADVPNGRVPGRVDPEIAVPFTAAVRGHDYYVVVRAARGVPRAVIRPVQRAVWALDPQQAFRSSWTEDETLWMIRYGWPRFRTSLLVLFGTLSLALAAAGVYGILSYTIAAEMREIGLRLALGAGRAVIVRHVVGRALRPAAAGLLAGAALAAAGGTFVRTFAGAVSPWDPLAYAAAAIVLVLVTLAATMAPAWRAARVDPLTTLKGG